MNYKCIQPSKVDSFICSATLFFNSSKEAQEEILHHYEWTCANLTSKDIYFKFYRKKDYWEERIPNISFEYFELEEEIKNE